MKISRIVLSILVMLSVYGASYAIDGFHHIAQNPVKSFIEFDSPGEFVNRFKGDTIFFYIPNSGDRYFESFFLQYPDTIWLKERPKKKKPEREKHYRLRTNYLGVSGWGVNSHRFYTTGSSIENKMFVIHGCIDEHIEYLGNFHYILLEDIKSGAMIKWDYSKNENTDLVIFSPSISRRLNNLRNKKMEVEVDTILANGTCKDVAYSIDVKRSKWFPKLYVTIETDKGNVSSTNWFPRYYVIKDER